MPRPEDRGGAENQKLWQAKRKRTGAGMSTKSGARGGMQNRKIFKQPLPRLHFDSMQWPVRALLVLAPIKIKKLKISYIVFLIYLPRHPYVPFQHLS